MNRPKVSACIITYNHENYIKACLDGAVLQNVDFDYEIIIGDDSSSDSTSKICSEYASKYPNLIKYIKRDINLGMIGNWIATISECSGKYIALCEGDDLWTDTFKLQKQVDFLEANEDYSMCTHVALEKNEITHKEHFFPNIKKNTIKGIEDYVLNNSTATCSLVFKSEFIRQLPIWFSKLKFGDLGLIIYVLKISNKKMMVLNDSMSVYRVNAGSVHGKLKNNNKDLVKAYLMHIEFTDLINNELFENKLYQTTIFKKYINTFEILERLSDNFLIKYKYRIQKIYFKLRLKFLKVNP